MVLSNTLIHKHSYLEILFTQIWVRKEGGEFKSASLRAFYREIYHVDVGMYSYGGCFSPSFNFGGGQITVGRYCSIASTAMRIGTNHPVRMFSTHPYFYNPAQGYTTDDIERALLVIGHGAWVGYNALIMPGCTHIGNGAIVGAGSILTRDVPPYAIFAGNPARQIGMRFSDKEIRLLEESKWWERSPEELINFRDSFFDVESFSARLNKEQ